ncbi:MAG: N-acetylmuramoyl-L-alanine amidase, partial [Phycisphaerae bacterium]|nr:N-acetylmuramoyl-L-alanine amidase [Phycisphaerae bacterium]
ENNIRNAMHTEAPPPRPTPKPDPLSGRRWLGTVVLDAGHGGKDPGAMGAGGDREADIVLGVTREAATMLQHRGIKVLLTRDDDTFVELDDRVSFAGRHRPDLFVSIHVDAAGNTQARGYTVYVPRRAAEDSPSEQAGERIARGLERVVAVSRGVRRHAKNLRVLEKTSVPAVLVELGFITNAGECRLLLRREYQARLAGALVGGIEAWLKQR